MWALRREGLAASQEASYFMIQRLSGQPCLAPASDVVERLPHN